MSGLSTSASNNSGSSNQGTDLVEINDAMKMIQDADGWNSFVLLSTAETKCSLSKSVVARLPTEPSRHSNSQLYDFGLEPKVTADKNVRADPSKKRFLRLFDHGRLDFNGAPQNPFGGVIVQPSTLALCNNSCAAQENLPFATDATTKKENELAENRLHPDEASDDFNQWSTLAITIFNEKWGKYISINTAGMFVTSDSAVPLRVRHMPRVIHGENEPNFDPFALRLEDKEHFKTQGYLILRKAVPREYLVDARRSINAQLGSYYREMTTHPDSNNKSRNGISLPEPLRARIINRSPLLSSALNLLLGASNLLPWQGPARFQLALKFPQPPYDGTFNQKTYEQHAHPPYTRPKGKQWHIDSTQNLCPFVLLVGVALSDQSKEGMGNLYVYPEQHQNPDVLSYCQDNIGKPISQLDDNKPSLGESVPILLEEGDVVLAHALLPHTASLNSSDGIRYQLYYRVVHASQREFGMKWLEDPMIAFDV